MMGRYINSTSVTHKNPVERKRGYTFRVCKKFCTMLKCLFMPELWLVRLKLLCWKQKTVTYVGSDIYINFYSLLSPPWFEPRVTMLLRPMATPEWISDPNMKILEISDMNFMKDPGIQNVEKIWLRSTLVDWQLQKSLTCRLTTQRLSWLSTRKLIGSHLIKARNDLQVVDSQCAGRNTLAHNWQFVGLHPSHTQNLELMKLLFSILHFSGFMLNGVLVYALSFWLAFSYIE